MLPKGLDNNKLTTHPKKVITVFKLNMIRQASCHLEDLQFTTDDGSV